MPTNLALPKMMVLMDLALGLFSILKRSTEFHQTQSIVFLETALRTSAQMILMVKLN
jgi:hypothetical protein